MEKTTYMLTSDGELYRYGIVGMKWGVRRSGMKAVDKARKKAAKFALKSSKKQMKYLKLEKKSIKRGDQDLSDRAKKIQAKAAKLQLKSAKYNMLAIKGEKYYKKLVEKGYYNTKTNKEDED